MKSVSEFEVKRMSDLATVIIGVSDPSNQEDMTHSQRNGLGKLVVRHARSLLSHLNGLLDAPQTDTEARRKLVKAENILRQHGFAYDDSEKNFVFHIYLLAEPPDDETEGITGETGAYGIEESYMEGLQRGDE